MNKRGFHAPFVVESLSKIELIPIKLFVLRVKLNLKENNGMRKRKDSKELTFPNILVLIHLQTNSNFI